MRKYFLIIILPFLIWNCSSTSTINDSQQVITPGLLEEYISYLASDELMGRNTPGPALDSAAAYIASKFESFGLQKINGSYFQKINLGYVSLGEKNHLNIIRNGTETILKIKDDFVPFDITGNSSTEGKLIFCGYGIEAPEYKYNDYANADVNGKIVLILKHEPRENDSASVFDGAEQSDYSDLNHKVKNAADKGASAVIVVNDPLNHSSLRPVGFPWPSLSKIIPKDAIPLTILNKKYKNIPVVQAGTELINIVFGSADNLKNLQKKIDAEMTGYSAEFDDITVSLGTSIIVDETPAYNVTAFLEGSDAALKNEVLVIGAHYDHSGVKKNTPAGEDSILNGADDNASGTAAMMSIAKAFSQMKTRPKRSILFIAFAGEEKGLFGSNFYLDNPLFPLENTVAMLNLDMIGRNHPDSVWINAHSRSPVLKKINEEENEEIGLTLVHRNEKSVGGSDHAPFIKKGITALFYHSGTHEDYHKVTDEASLINFEKAARISRLAFRTAFRIANESRRYKVTNKSTSLIY